MFNTFKHGVNKFSISHVNSNIAKSTNIFQFKIHQEKNLFKSCHSKFFSTKLKENISNLSANDKSKDFFESNFRIDKAPDHISAVIIS
jgi:hypothetical protein